jgi:UDPglucose 6-dehydrogenase
MKITIIGAGYVGLVSGACFAEFGVDVCMVDNAPEKIEALKRGTIRSTSPAWTSWWRRTPPRGALSFTTDIHAGVQGADAVFSRSARPSRRGDGHADLSFVYAAAEEVARAATGPLVLVTKSTVPVGTGREVKRRVQACGRTWRSPSPPTRVPARGRRHRRLHAPDRVVIGVEEARRASAPPTSCAACTARST